MDAVLQRDAMVDEMEPETRSLRSRRVEGVGNQIAGTRSRRKSSASTLASILSVLQARGASPFTRCASAISTSQPASLSVSWTKGHRSSTR